MDRETRNLIHQKADKIKEVDRPPGKRDGENGDMRIYQHDLYIRTRGTWLKLMSGDKVVQQEVTKNISSIVSEGVLTHGALTGITSDQHHSQLHTLASHTTDSLDKLVVDTTVLVVNPDSDPDKVGIGTATPDSLLHVKSSTGHCVEIEDTSSAHGGLRINKADGSNYDPILEFQDSGTTRWTVACDRSDSDKLEFNDTVLVLETGGNVGIGTASPSTTLHVHGGDATMALLSSNGVGSNNSSIQFKTDADGGTPKYGMIGFDYSDDVVKMVYGSSFDGTAGIVIDSSNRVGIGTASPGYTLDVDKSVTGNWVARILNSATSGNPSGLLVRVDDPDSTGVLFGANANGTYRMVVETSGNVGIGVVDPSNTLEVLSTSAQQKWSYDVDSFATIAVADASHTTVATGESGDLTLAPAGDIYMNPTGDDIFPGVNGSPAYDINIGALDKKFLTIHAQELWVETLVAQNTIATIGGRIIIAPTSKLKAALADGAGDTTLTVEHNTFGDDDYLLMQANGKFEVVKIDGSASGSGPYTYTIERNQDGSGRNAWDIGDAIINTGSAAGDGFIDMFSISGVGGSIYGEGNDAASYGPTITGQIRSGTGWSDWGPMWAIGNLNGYYGKSSTNFGIGLGKWDGGDSIVIQDGDIRFYNDKTTIAEWDGAAIGLGGAVGTGAYTAQLNATTISLYGAAATDGVFITSTGVEIKKATNDSLALTAGSMIMKSNNVAQFAVSDNGMNIGPSAVAPSSGGSPSAVIGNVSVHSAGVHIYGAATNDYINVKSDGVDIVTAGTTAMALSDGNIAMTGKISIIGGTGASATDNVCIGSWSSGNPDVGEGNVVIGLDAGNALDANTDNVVLIGKDAGKIITSSAGSDSVAIGHQAMALIAAPEDSVAVGYQAHYRGATSRFNVAIGHKALFGKDTSLWAKYNVAIGTGAMENADGDTDDAGGAVNNTAIGHQSMMDLDGGSNNIALGHTSLKNVEGTYNIGIGIEAGATLTSGSGNVIIGKAAIASGTGSDQLSISSGDGDVTWITGDSSGDITIGGNLTVTSNNSSWIGEFHNTNTGTATDGVRILLSMGDETATDNAYWMGFYDQAGIEGGIRGLSDNGVDFDSISDRRLKDSIVDIPDGLSIISQMKPRNFYWKSQSSLSAKPLQYGFIADEFEVVFPGTVSGKRDSNGELIPNATKEDGSIYRQMMDANKYTVPVLVKAIQELSAKVTALEAQIN